jgi:hypothetical protein
VCTPPLSFVPGVSRPLLAGLVVFAVLLLGAGRTHAATPLAVFPTSGPAGAEPRAALDAALRKAVGNDSRFALLSAQQTLDNIAFLSDGGPPCAADDVECLQKFGLVAGVDVVLVAHARGRKMLEVTLRLVDASHGRVLTTVEGTLLPRDVGAVRALVDRALDHAQGGVDPSSPSTTTPTEGEPAIGDVGGDGTAEKANPHVAGFWLLGVGGGLGALGLFGALGGEALFWTGTGSAAWRRDVVLPATQVLWGVALVGAVAAGAGGGFLWVTRDDARGTDAFAGTGPLSKCPGGGLVSPGPTQPDPCVLVDVAPPRLLVESGTFR